MSTIIDALVVSLGFESSGLDKGTTNARKKIKETGDEADKTGKKLKGAGKDGADGFNNLAASATKFLAVLGGAAALERFIVNTIEATTQVARFSRNLGESASNVNAWSNAAELAGGSAAGLQGTFDKLSMAQTELEITGSSSLIPYLSSLGVAFGAGVTPAQQLLELSDRFSRMDRTKANNLGRMMGIDQGTMNLLLKGRPEVELMIKRQKELNDLNKKQTEVSERLSKAFTESKQSFAAFGRELMTAVAPAIEWVFKALTSVGDWIRENQEFVGITLKAIAFGLGILGAALLPINLPIAGLVALGAAIGLLYQDYLVWKRGGDSFFGDDWKKIEDGVKIAKVALQGLGEILKNQFYRAIAFVDMVIKIGQGDWKGAKYAGGEFISGDEGLGSFGRDAAPDTTAQRTSSGKIGGLGPQTPQKFFESKGWTAEQAAGIVANLQSESSMNSAAVGDGGKAYGVAQWHPDRQAAFAKWAGKDIRKSTLEEQLAFVHYELTQGNEQAAGDALRNAATAQRAGEVVSTRYERPADTAGEMVKRGAVAQRMFGGIPGASGAAQGVGAPNVARAAQTINQGAGNRSAETHIGEMNIYTQATDANGIARDMGGAIDNLQTAQFASGLR